MGLDLPGELRSLLSLLGYTWPEADEEKLVAMGQAWVDFAGRLADVTGSAADGASQVWSGNEGADIAAFRDWWARDGSPAGVLKDGVTGAAVTGSGLMVCGGIVLALKVAVIVQLGILAVEIAQAVATSELTFGASLAEIPVFQQLTRTVIGNLVQEALWTLADG